MRRFVPALCLVAASLAGLGVAACAGGPDEVELNPQPLPPGRGGSENDDGKETSDPAPGSAGAPSDAADGGDAGIDGEAGDGGDGG